MKKLLKNAGGNVILGLDDILTESLNGSGYNSQYGLLGSNEAFSLPYADSVLAMTGPMFNAIQEVTAEALQDITAAYNTMMAEYEVKQKELAELWKELQPPSRLDPLGIFTAVDMPVFENPNQYIERKTTSNIADIVGYNAIQTFYENALNLYPV